jgi:hypothetical protein
MNNTNELFPVVRDEIEFETLLVQAMQSLKTYSGQYWTDMAEHDPGVTLLEAQAYGVADLAYRQTRPLTDLLTPENQREGEGLFPAEFGPHQALTCGPVSETDYRRALLDLRSNDAEDGYFLFLNAQLVREPDRERYTYWYNPEDREYSFTQPPAEKTPVCMTLLGNYHLYLVPSRETQLSPDVAHDVLTAFLINNRNLGEAVSRVIWLVPEDFNPELVIELEDEIDSGSNIAAILTDIFQVAEQYVTPAVMHVSTEQLQAEGMSSENIYQGPWLKYGWIPRLPPSIVGTEPGVVNLSGLVSALQTVAGVKGIRHLAVQAENTASSRWQWVSASAGVYPRLWGSDPLAVLAAGATVKLLASGDVQLTAAKLDIQAELDSPVVIRNQAKVMASGRWRNPGQYYPATDLVPPCYNLRVPAGSTQQKQLHQFLLVFEQLLANGCRQLALLPALLSFQRQGDEVWGQQWPFADGSVSNEVHQDYRKALERYLVQRGHDREQELTITGFLLGYFNSLLAPAVFSQPADRFLASQQGFLSRHTELTYHRANIRADQVSSLQRRIAARLGLGGAEIFNDNTSPDQLPFYLVEHRALMPVLPSVRYDVPQTPVNVRVEYEGTLPYLVLSGGSVWDVADLSVGQLIDIWLGYGTSNVLQIRGQMVARINKSENNFWLDISASSQLGHQLDEILSANPGELAWQNSAVWLEDMTYPLQYASDQSRLEENQKRLSCSPFPVMVARGDTLTLDSPVSQGVEMATDTYMTVISVDRIQNTLVVQKAAGDVFPTDDLTGYWSWYFTENRLATADRFSLMSSVVFNQEMLLNLTSDPYATEAWVREIILAEIPSHTGVLIHWKPLHEFKAFAATYRRWLESGSMLGDASYDLMHLLALGKLPDEILGIGSMYIATEEERDSALAVSDGWDEDYIAAEQLFNIPLVGRVTLTIEQNNAWADGLDTNRVTATVEAEDGRPVAGAFVSFWVDNGATIETSGTTDDSGRATVTLTSFTPGTCRATASYKKVRGKAEVNFTAPQALNGTLAVNGYSFPTSSGFPTTGFTGATFRIQVEGAENTSYIWSKNQPWVSVDDDGNVTFNGEPTGKTKTVTVYITPKNGVGNRYAWTFTVNSWFLGSPSSMLYNEAPGWCSVTGGGQPAVSELTNGVYGGARGSRMIGNLWSEWGAMDTYTGASITSTVYWVSDMHTKNSPLSVYMLDGFVEWRYTTSPYYSIRRKHL